MKILGLDHADIRVPSLAAVEAFYDALLPALGLSRKSESHVGSDGEWVDVDVTHPRNVVEYHTPIVAGSPGWFVGFIEDPGMKPTATRVAFALDAEANLRRSSRSCATPAAGSSSGRSTPAIPRSSSKTRRHAPGNLRSPPARLS